MVAIKHALDCLIATDPAATAAGKITPAAWNDSHSVVMAATKKVVGRKSALGGDAEEVSLTELLDWIGTATQGDILFRDASTWARLPTGTAGQVLVSGGAGANPRWATPSTFASGDVKLTFATTAPAGWILMDDGTIGNGTSGASTRANDDCGPVYTVLWNALADADAPVAGGRGANAAADFAAGKKMTLTKVLGYALGVAGAGSGLTTRVLGRHVGEETHTLTSNESAVLTYTSTVTDNGHQHNFQFTDMSGDSTFGQYVDQSAQGGTTSAIFHTMNATTGISVGTTANAGGAAHNNMPPTTYLNAMLCL